MYFDWRWKIERKKSGKLRSKAPFTALVAVQEMTKEDS